MKKISVLILCRSSSKRLKHKHFKKIGNFTLIEIIINKFLLIKEVSEIIIATGPKKKNYIYEFNLKQKYKNKIKFFYHNNEFNVNERIFKLTKKIKNNYLLTFSGDCPIVDQGFIKKLFKSHLKYNQYDYLKIKNCIVEGVDIYKKKLWYKINQYSKASKMLMEHPGYIIKKRPELFKIKELSDKSFEPYKNKKHLRASIDTQSDLDFFRAFYYYVKSYSKFNYNELYKYSYLNYFNNHVVQKKNIDSLKNKIFLITFFSKKFGGGHLSRINTIEREINETTTSYTQKIIFNSDKKKNINKKLKFLKLKNFNNKIIIIDVPKFLIKKFYFLCKKNKILVVDNILKSKNSINIIPSLRNPEIQKSSYVYGKKSIILKRDINIYNLFDNKKNRNYVFVFPGSTSEIPAQIFKFCINNKELNFVFFSKKLKLQKVYSDNIIFFNNNNDFLKLAKQAKAIITRHGVFTYECIALKKKVFVWTFNESNERLKDINYLNKLKYIKILKFNTFISDLKSNFSKKIDLSCGCPYIIRQINKFNNLVAK